MNQTLEEVERLAADLEREFSLENFDVIGHTDVALGKKNGFDDVLPLQAQLPRGSRSIIFHHCYYFC